MQAAHRSALLCNGPAPAPAHTSISGAILDALAYADVFDWPLSAVEIHRALPMTATQAEVDDVLASCVSAGLLTRVAGVFVLFERDELAELRRQRERVSQRLWPQAVRYGRWIAALPFVAMVAVSGSLAVNAAGADADIDFFVVTEDGRLWTARAMIIGVVRASAAGRGATLCPNYLVSSSDIEFAERDVFTAHELVQLVPLYGGAAFDELIARNAWYREFLPNHPGPTPMLAGAPSSIGRRIAPLLRRRAFDRFERWEMDRKVAALTASSSGSPEVRFDEVACKGHLDGHRQRVLDAHSQRLQRLGISA